jgi:hypothetical protein
MGDAMAVFVSLLKEQVVLHASQPILKIADSLVYTLVLKCSILLVII